MAIITLMTDFGLKDGNVGVMKGVIWSICPEAANRGSESLDRRPKYS